MGGKLVTTFKEKNKMKISVEQGDITIISANAIVNAANTSLLGGGGVDGAIHKTGGVQILEECRAIRNRQGGCKTGEAVYTSGGNLVAEYVIHTVGPVWCGGNKNEEELLSRCYENSLRIAEDLNVKVIAFPNISTGIYNFPKELAAEIAVRTVKIHKSQKDSIEEVLFICYDQENYEIYKRLLKDELGK